MSDEIRLGAGLSILGGGVTLDPGVAELRADNEHLRVENERLRINLTAWTHKADVAENEVDCLRAENDRLRAALEPTAENMRAIGHDIADHNGGVGRVEAFDIEAVIEAIRRRGGIDEKEGERD